ncbi:MAG: hypothetical protein ABDH32_04400 [Candidatus Caldarchaeales archaeon]
MGHDICWNNDRINIIPILLSILKHAWIIDVKDEVRARGLKTGSLPNNIAENILEVYISPGYTVFKIISEDKVLIYEDSSGGVLNLTMPIIEPREYVYQIVNKGENIVYYEIIVRLRPFKILLILGAVIAISMATIVIAVITLYVKKRRVGWL